MTVRAKFKVESVTQTHSGNKIQHTVKLRPVISGSAENEEFFAYTPGGEITLSVLNDAAGNEFEAGKDHYVDFTAA